MTSALRTRRVLGGLLPGLAIALSSLPASAHASDRSIPPSPPRLAPDTLLPTGAPCIASILRPRAAIGAVALAFPAPMGDTLPEVEPVLDLPPLFARILSNRMRILTGAISEGVREGSAGGRIVASVAAAMDDPEELRAGLVRAILDVPDPGEIERAWSSLDSERALARGSPAAGFEEEVRERLFRAPASAAPGARPESGQAGGAPPGPVPSDRIAAAWRRWIRMEDADGVWIGPIRPPGDPGGASVVCRERPARPAAWSEGGRWERRIDAVSAWITVAWPIGEGTGPLEARFLASLLEDRLDPVPADPDRFNLSTAVEWDGRNRGVLRISATVSPTAVERWTRALEGAPEELLRAPPDPGFLALHRRRFTSRELLAEALPEDAAFRIARWGARGDAPGSSRLDEQIRSLRALSAPDLLRAAGGLGPARILIHSPHARGTEP